ncbi:hypothetical protein [Streptomyces sp. SM10]|uniref:hypothetical protein n=1 Tax=Streptomyces sp. SM10 TaxID=565556 RepID=UPI000CDAADEC|nr:hypothetical protein [Streptomyces sp. SM10]
MGIVERLRAAGEFPIRDGLYRPDDTGLKVYVEGPGAYHPQAGQTIPFHLGGPLGVAEAVEEEGSTEADLHFESALPDGSGWMSGGGGGMGNIGYLARLDSGRSPLWVLALWSSNPFVGVRHEGTWAVFANDWGNLLHLDLADPALARPAR